MELFLGFVHTLHAVERWILALLALFIVVSTFQRMRQRAPLDNRDTMALKLYSILFSIQFVLGLIQLGSLVIPAMQIGASLTPVRLQMEHATTMIIALGLSHAAAAARRKEPSRQARMAFIFSLASLVLIIVGVVRLKGWEMWMRY